MAVAQKRTSNHLSPPRSALQKRYLWEPTPLLEKNKYFVLENMDENNSIEEMENLSTPNAEHKIKKIPPIYLHGTHNHKEVVTDIKQLLESDFTINYTTTALKINVKTEEDYIKLRKHYTDNKIQYHTYHNPETKPLSVVMKNVPPSLSAEEILADLEDYKLPIKKITRLYYKDKTPMPVCVIDLEATEKASAIYKINKLGNSIVKIEARRTPKDIPQCHRCQRIGHTKNYCTLEPRCLKCSKNHLYTECDKVKSAPPKCVNCNEPHPANYRGCKAFHESQQNRANRSLPIATRTETNPTTYQTTTQNKTYASAAKSTTSTPHQLPQNNIPTDTSSPVSQILSFIVNLIQPYFEQIKTFVLTQVIPMFFNGQ